VPLAAHYLKATAARYGKDVKAFAPEAMQLLLAAPLAREREATGQRDRTGGRARVPRVLCLRRWCSRPEGGTGAACLAGQARGAFEREYLIRILRITGGSVTQAAKLAQRNRTSSTAAGAPQLELRCSSPRRDRPAPDALCSNVADGDNICLRSRFATDDSCRSSSDIRAASTAHPILLGLEHLRPRAVALQQLVELGAVPLGKLGCLGNAGLR